MSAEDLGLGELIEEGRDVHRDAIHIAVAPVVAAEKLVAGQHVGLVDNDVNRVTSKTKDYIGIIDPFLRCNVRKDERCWLYLYPGTITSLRHEWTHPAWTEALLDVIDGESRRFVEGLAAQAGISYAKFMDGALMFNSHGEHLYMGSNEDYASISVHEWEEFWGKHFPRLTGKKVNQPEYGCGNFFSCSC